MSEDLRYYFFDNDPDDQPPVPAQEGWNNMRQLLDAEMPVSSKRAKRRAAFWVGAVVVGVAMIFFAMRASNDSITKEDSKLAVKENKSTNSAVTENETSLNGDQEKLAETEQQMNEQIIRSADNELILSGKESIDKVFTSGTKAETKTKQIQSNKVLTATTKPFNIKDDATTEIAGKTIDEKTKVDKVIPETTVTTSTPGIVNNTTEDVAASQTTNAGKQKNSKKSNDKGHIATWQYSVGAGVNFSLSKGSQALQPYPFATAQYNLSPTVFLSGSVALFSPVATSTSGIRKTVYLNDTTSNVSRYNETLNFKRLHYADVTVQAGLRLSKKISVSAGIQASKLLSAKSYTTLEPYDFNSDRVALTNVDTFVPTPSAAPVYSKQVDARKLDIRYVAGVNYDLNKLTIGLQYQGGLKPLLTGDAVKGDKAQLVTLKLAYRLK